MKAIRTRYKGATNSSGARIIADDYETNRITISYPYELSGEDVFRKAAEALCDKLGWSKELLGGGTNDGYVFVFKN